MEEDWGTHNVTVNLSSVLTSPITLNYTVGGTATAGSDFTIANSGALSVPKGATIATIPVTLVDDSEQESSETVVLTLAAGSDYQVGSPGNHTLTVLDDETPTVLDDETPPTVSFEPLEGRNVNARTSWVQEESGTHNLKLTLDKAPASALTVKCTVSGSAVPGADYTALSGTLTVPAGATTATLPVTLIDDDTREHSESITLHLTTDGTDYRLARPSSYILIIDPSEWGPWVAFAMASDAAGEGSGTHDVGVRLGPAPSADVTFAYTVGGTATAGVDYTALSGTVTVPKGATEATIAVTLSDDSVQEGRETVTLRLAGSAGYPVTAPSQHTLSIVDDETPVVSFASASQRAGEGSGTHDVGVRLDPAPAAGLTLEYHVGGTATAGADYTALSGTLAVSAGATTAVIPVTVIDDNVYDGRETVVLTLIERAGYQLGSPERHALTIVDNETAPFPGPAVTIAAGTSPVTEDGDATFTLTATPAPKADLPVTVTVAADGDFGIAAGERTVTIPTAGSVTLTVATTGDDADEPDGSVTVTVTDGDGYTVGSSASDSVTVRDDDDTTPDWTDYQTVVSYLIEVRDNPKNTAVKGNSVHIAKWNRVAGGARARHGDGRRAHGGVGHPRERGPVAGQPLQGGLGVPEVAGSSSRSRR